MNPLVLAIMMVAMSAGAFDIEPAFGAAPVWLTPAVVAAAYGAMIVLAWAGGALAARGMDHAPARAAALANRTQAALAGARWLCLALFIAFVYTLDLIGWLRAHVADVVAVPEMLAVAGPLLTIAATWWACHPVELRLRQAAMIRQLDQGAPIPGLWSRAQYTWWHVRHQMALFFVMLVLMLVWTQTVERHLVTDATPDLAAHALAVGGAAVVLFCVPLMIRVLWDVRPLADGLLRERLLKLCAAHGVGVRNLLVWHTCGGMVNAAVVGFLRPVRYILVTDGMIERLRNEEVEAIMAHELGHVVRHHLPWMLVCGAAILAGVGLGLALVVEGLLVAFGVDLDAFTPGELLALDGGGLTLTVALWALFFGVVSRRMERQADTFSAQHMADRFVEIDQTPGRIGPHAAATVAETLLRVAALNHIPAKKRAWRHGSIASRAAYLRSLVGTPVDACPIDRRVKRTCYACLLLLVAAVAAMTWLDSTATIPT